jgi:hypothetical protein
MLFVGGGTACGGAAKESISGLDAAARSVTTCAKAEKTHKDEEQGPTHSRQSAQGARLAVSVPVQAISRGALFAIPETVIRVRAFLHRMDFETVKCQNPVKPPWNGGHG